MSDEDKRKLKIGIIACCIALIIAALINHFFFTADDEEAESETITDDETLDDGIETEDNESSDSDSEDDTYEIETIYDMTDYDVTEDEPGTTSVSEKKMGSITIEYNTSDATAYSGRVSDYSVDFLYFTDGDDGNLTGAIYALEAVGDSEGVIESVEDAEEAVDAYTSAGSGVTTEWEECEDWFVRKSCGYDTEYDMAIISFMILPKSSNVDSYSYTAAFSMSEGEEDILYNGEALKESSFNSMITGLRSLASDSELLSITYDELCDELQEILYWETADGNNYMGGIQELKTAAAAYIYQLYGVSLSEYDDLTDEEKNEAIRNASDPVGRAQKAAKEAERAAYDSDEEEEETESITHD